MRQAPSRLQVKLVDQPNGLIDNSPLPRIKQSVNLRCHLGEEIECANRRVQKFDRLLA
jgi:hypothetical protein